MYPNDRMPSIGINFSHSLICRLDAYAGHTVEGIRVGVIGFIESVKDYSRIHRKDFYDALEDMKGEYMQKHIDTMSGGIVSGQNLDIEVDTSVAIHDEKLVFIVTDKYYLGLSERTQ